MTDPTPVDDIVVNGQRKWPNGQFPVRTGEPSTGETPGPTALEVGLEPDPPTMPDPCASPETARDWNVDAGGAEGLRKMREKAAEIGEPDFASREFGAALYLLPDGTIQVGPVSYGPPMGGAVEIIWDAYPEEYLIGTIHSHPSSGRPSPPDLAGLDYIAAVSSLGPYARVYVVQPTYDGGGPRVDRIFVYNQTNRSGDQNGPEVNPEGTACPGSSISS